MKKMSRFHICILLISTALAGEPFQEETGLETKTIRVDNITDVNNNVYIPTNTKIDIPRIGIRFSQQDDEETIKKLTKFALETLDVRLIDLPLKKENAVLEAIKLSGVDRKDVFLVYKQDYKMFGFEDTKSEVEDLFERTGLDYIDLYMIQYVDTKGFYVQTWKTMISYVHKKKIRSIGLCNVNFGHLNYLYHHTGFLPAVVQLEIHPFFQQQNLVHKLRELGVVVQAYATLAAGQKLYEPRLQRIAKRYGKTVAQTMIRWCLQKGYSCLTKSTKINRLAENVDVFDFELSEEDMILIDDLEISYVVRFNPSSLEHLRSVDGYIIDKLKERGIPQEVQDEAKKTNPNVFHAQEYSTGDTVEAKGDEQEGEEEEIQEEIITPYYFSTDINLEPGQVSQENNPDIDAEHSNDVVDNQFEQSDSTEWQQGADHNNEGSDAASNLKGEFPNLGEISKEQEKSEEAQNQQYDVKTQNEEESDERQHVFSLRPPPGAPVVAENEGNNEFDQINQNQEETYGGEWSAEHDSQENSWDENHAQYGDSLPEGIDSEWQEEDSWKTTESEVFHIPVSGIAETCKTMSLKAYQAALKEAGEVPPDQMMSEANSSNPVKEEL